MGYKLKCKADGSVERLKAKLVVKDLLKEGELIPEKPSHQW